ncbi:MAG: peptidyl-prolyl cis-trans isomerase [Ideonella sp.]|nr:peptidyl-prolyl cis-trans isomerase [Ideonella sp.]MCC7459578.1 peptidyl-prolyl cis-trans isomerase [Nitrospira sp.]
MMSLQRWLVALAIGALALPAAMAQKVKLATNLGTIVIELDAQKAPKTVANFVQYVKAGHYDGLIFHRVISGFMIQGGGFDAQMQQKATRPPIALESRNGLSNQRGTIAMARTMVPDSATSQFFINVVDNPRLDAANAADGNGYAVFGVVVSGLDVVDKIRAVPVGDKAGHQNVPLQPVVIEKATLENEK